MLLFQPDNFSNSEVKYKRYEGQKDDFCKILNDYFVDYAIVGIWQLDRLEINSENYKVCVRIADQDKFFLLRRYKALTDSEQIEFYLNLLGALRDKEAEVPVVLKNKGGTCGTLVDDNFYALFVFIESGYFYPSENTLRSVAKSIALMHRAFDNLPEDYHLAIGTFSARSKAYFNVVSEYSLDDFNSILKILSQRDHLTENDAAVLDRLPTILEVVDEVSSARQRIEGLPKEIIHSDLHPHNILIIKDAVGAITDFDAIRISQQARDVAFAIYRFGRQFLIGKSLEEVKILAPKLVRIFIEDYNNIKSLNSEEKDLMPFLIKDEFLRKLLFVLRGVYLENNTTWARDLPKFLVFFEEINYFWPANA